MSSKKSTQNKHDPISESEPEYSTDEGDEFSSDCEVEKTPQKKSKETKKTSKDSSSSKKVVHRSDKEKERKRKLSKRRPQSPCPLTSFDADIGLDISSIKFKPKKAKISSIVNIERKMIKVTEPGKKPYEYAAIVFVRKAGDKVFEFNLPLNLLPKIIKGLHYIEPDKEIYSA